MQEAVHSAAQALAQSGAQLSPEPPPRLQNVFSMWTAAMTAAIAATRTRGRRAGLSMRTTLTH